MSKRISLPGLLAAAFFCFTLFPRLAAQVEDNATGIPVRIWAQGVCGPTSYQYQIGYYYVSSATYYGLQYPGTNENNYQGVLRYANGTVAYIYLLPVYDTEYVTADLELSGDFTPWNPATSDKHAALGTTGSSEGENMPVDLGLVRIVPGKTYNLSITQANLTGGAVNVVAPPGYRVVLNGMPRNGCGLASTVTIRVLPTSDSLSASTAGHASTVAGSKVDWHLSLGSLRNGDSAGTLELVDTGASSSLSYLFTPGALSYQATSDEVFVYQTGGAIRQIIANQVAVDVVTLNSTSYEIRCYNPAQIQSYVPCAFSGQPFAVYRIAQGGTATTLSFTKETRNIPDPFATNVPITRSETMTFQRTGTWPNCTWTKTDWTLSGQAPLVGSSVQSSGTVQSNGTVPARSEAIAVGVPGNATTFNLARSYTLLACGEVLASETAGSANSQTLTLNYFADTTKPGSFGFVNSVSLPGGGWEAYDYYDTSLAKSYQTGRVKYRYRPAGNAPASVTRDPAQGEVTYYEYGPDPFGFMTRPTLVQTYVKGTPVARSAIAYSVLINTNSNVGLIRSTRHDSKDSSTFLESITKYYSEDSPNSFLRGRKTSVQQPDGVKQTYIYESGGIWDGTNYVTSGPSGYASRISVITGSASSSAGTLSSIYPYYSATYDPVYLVNGKSTREVTIRDERALVVRTESYIWISSAWQLVSYVNYGYNFMGLLISRTASNGATYTATYDGLLKTSETGESGVTTSYLYDAAGRVTITTRQGAGVLGSVSTRFLYDALSHVLEQRVGWGQTEQIVTTKSFDDAGRLVAETPPGLGTTTHAYDVANRIHTATRPDGSTAIETSNRDGQLASRTGTAVVAEYHSYDADPASGQRWTQINSGSANSPRWKKSWSDWLGREVQAQQPGFAGSSALVSQKFYDDVAGHTSTGHLVKTTQPGYAPTLYAYDVLGRVIRSGLDVNNTGTLDLASLDRISESDQWIELYNGAYWSHSESKTYPTANSATAIMTSVQRTRLTGFPAGRISETQSTDVEGNVTTQTTDLNRATATTTITTTSTGLAHAQVDIQVAGLATSSTSFDGLTTTVGYDALLRKHTVTNSRNNTATTTYLAGTTLVQSVTDATGAVVATNAYDALGRTTSVTDAAGFAAYSAYNLRSQLVRQWGPATYPVEYGYDAATGERTSMSTYRGGTAWNGTTWPTGNTGTADTTTWAFDPATGLLTTKTDALGRAAAQTYNQRGQTATRTLARGVTTTYGYDANTGELLSQTYSDTTPAVTYTYNRQGKVATVVDYIGTRTLGYDVAKPWRFVTESIGAFYGNRVETRLYETGGLIGRVHGFQVGSAPGSNADQENTFAFTADGRFNALTSGRNADAALRTFHYGYEPNSALLKTLAVVDCAFSVTRTFETQRDLLTSTDAQWSTASVARYDYTSNNLGQRVTLKQSGTAFSDYGDPNTFRSFAYDSRGQLTGDTGYLGATTDDTKKLPGRAFEFAYDTIGNRQSANHTGVPALGENYTTNALNQYTAKENNAVAVSGTADADSRIVVAGHTSATWRQGRFWSDEITVGNATGPWRGPISIFAGKAETGGTNRVRLENRMVQIGASLQHFEYDADGNLTTDGIWDYQYDAENRLIRMETNSTAVTCGFPRRALVYRYDYLGRRVLKQSLSWDVSLATWNMDSERRFLYDGWNLVAEFSSTSTSTLNLVRSYTWGLDIVSSLTEAGGVGALLQIADHASGKTYLPTYDGNGNVAALLNADTGALAAAYEYSPYGEPLRSETLDPTVADQPFRFSTKFTDIETGLVYYGHRYYSPSLGRFINRDPIEESGGLNLYGFCGNNGVNRWDLLGNVWVTINGKLYDAGTFPAPVVDVTKLPAGTLWAWAPSSYSGSYINLSWGTASGFSAFGGGFYSYVAIATPVNSGTNTTNSGWSAGLVLPSGNSTTTTPRPKSNLIDGYTASAITPDVVATLLINEVAFPGSDGFTSWDDTKRAMDAIAAELYNRIHSIPSGWTQQQIANITTSNYKDLILDSGQYQDFKGVEAARVVAHIEYLVSIANRGDPGPYADAINHAITLARLLWGGGVPTDPFASQGGTYYHMQTGNSPGGSTVFIDTSGGNDFFTVKPIVTPTPPVNLGLETFPTVINDVDPPPGYKPKPKPKPEPKNPTPRIEY